MGETAWSFVLTFRLPGGRGDPSTWLDNLFEAGCDDATVGVGRPGAIALDFTRTAPTAEAALASAIADVERAIPGAELMEAAPDLVNLADLAGLVGCSRQNIRKYAAGEIRSVTAPFPAPVHSGTPSLWRLAEVLAWLRTHADLHPPQDMVTLAQAVARLNLDVQRRRILGAAAAE